MTPVGISFFQKSAKFSPAFLIVAALIGAGIAYGHGDKKHDDSEEQDKQTSNADSSSVDQSGLESLKNSLDSVHVLISVSYETVKPIFENSCYDCHSSKTNFPWYYSLPIISGMIDDDIKEARKHLDMDNGFPFGGHATQTEQLKEIKEEIEDGNMPLWSYRLMHSGTKIEGATQDTVFKWIDESVESIAKVYDNYGYPAPSGGNVDDGHDDSER